jgi:hypothetical protein
MARVTTVKAARKAQGRCGRCGKEIEAGDGYRHASPGFRSRKLVRCLEDKCRFRASDLTTSKVAQVYAAVEAVEDSLPIDAEDHESVKAEAEGLVSGMQEEIEGVRDEYQEALDQWEYGNEQIQEKVDEVEEWVNACENWECPDLDEDMDLDDYAAQVNESIEELLAEIG